MRLPSNYDPSTRRKTDTTAIGPPFPLLRPAVDFVAGLRLSVHRNLLAGFLTGALLLVAMAALSLVVIARMDERMEALETQARKVDLAADAVRRHGPEPLPRDGTPPGDHRGPRGRRAGTRR